MAGQNKYKTAWEVYDEYQDDDEYTDSFDRWLEDKMKEESDGTED